MVTKLAFSQTKENVISVADYGAVGDGVNDDTAAIQAAIDATPNKGKLYIPEGNFKITTTLEVSKAITIEGFSRHATSFLTVGVSALKINKISNVKLRHFNCAAAVRHTTTPNTLIGIEIDGDNVNRAFNIKLQGIYVDGYQTAIKATNMWSSVLDTVVTANGQHGIRAYDLSVNNVITSCSFSCDGTGYGINLFGNTQSIEGWMISNTLIFNCLVGIFGQACTHTYVSNCILDFNVVTGIKIADNGANFGSNWSITNNYIAVGTAGGIGIEHNTSIVSIQQRGNTISNNHILSYSGSVGLYGIYITGSEAKYNIINGNTISNFSAHDVRSDLGDVTISNNTCLSSIASNIFSSNGGIIANNVGVVSYTEFTTQSKLGLLTRAYGEAAPTTGTWVRGDIVYDITPSASGFIGWVCVAPGTPGTWKTFGAISA